MKETKRALIQKFLLSQNLEVNSSVLDLYESICENYQFDQVKDALQRYIMRSDSNYKFKPQTLRELLTGFSLESLAHAQWIEVMQAITKIGPYHTVSFSHPVTNIVVSQMGWDTLNSKSDYEIVFVEKEFKKSFDAQYQHYVRGSHPAVVVGLLDRGNMNKQDVKLFDDVRFVCPDAAKIQKVIESGVKPSRPPNTQSLDLSATLLLTQSNEIASIEDNKSV